MRSLILSTALVFVATISAPAALVGATGTGGCALSAPTGASASTYTFNSQTGLWQNQYYTWDPATCQTTAITPQTFTYNWSTSKWDGSQWDYIPANNSWSLDPVSVTTPPTGSILVTPPNPALQITSDTGSGSNNSIDNSSNTNVNGTNNTQAGVNNQVTSTGQSGDATVSANTNAGDATSGNAVVSADVINQVQSSAALLGAATFTENIDGNVNGDIVVDPSSVVQPASGSSSLTNNNNLTDVNNVNTDQSINNTATLSAGSGDATVSENTNAGSATSGSADAVANVVNMINSMISSGQSFVGVINILGDLNGNILMPQQFLDSLIASNAPSSTVTISNNSNTTLSAAFNTDQNIVNNVNTSAQSGNASESANTNAGNTTSGNATTQVTIFNLVGDNVQATNTLLVFVNVLGQWVGLLMNAPAGATAAAFGSNVTQNTTNNANLSLDANTQQSIDNNINVNAKSGNANVDKNTYAGNATSGNANAAVNLLNMEGSSFNDSGWFGILFINVFGNWKGSFGVVVPLASTGAQGGSTSPLSQLDNTLGNSQNTKNAAATFGAIANSGSGSSNNLQLISAKIKSGQIESVSVTHKTVNNTQNVAGQQRLDSLLIGGTIVLIGISMFGLERFIVVRKTQA